MKSVLHSAACGPKGCLPARLAFLCILVAASASTQEGNKETEAPKGKEAAEVLAPPRWFGALGTYGRNVLFWRSTERSDRSATAVIIERREGEDGRWHAISPGIRDVDRWFDDDVRPGRSYSYRARSLAGARRGEFTPVRSASPRDPTYWYVLPSRIYQNDRLRAEYLDRLEELFWHHGPRPPGRSYGRFGAQFAELEPTPGRANIRAITK